MEYLVDNTSVELIDADAINIQNELPIRFYQFAYSKMRGLYLENTDYKTTHGKIYGDAEKIANHIVESYEKRDKNLGVLLSGGKGLGKSLTARLVIENLCKTHPVIIINEYIAGMLDTLKEISNAVILFDEFEKTFQGNADGSDNNTSAITKQEEMLSLLDGTAAGSHNLYIFTCNEVYHINENLMSRPGRIAYHYRYVSCGAETIRSYCKDHLIRKELEDSIVDQLLATRYVSLDIIQAVVEELNNFPEYSVSDIMEYMNINVDRIELETKITYLDKENNEKTASFDIGPYFTGKDYIRFYFESSDEEDKKDMSFSGTVTVDTKKIKIPNFGTLDVSNQSYIVWDKYEDYQPKITKIEIYDKEGYLSSTRTRVCGYENSIIG